jgi:purine-binding chemotaxis protein CheW
MNIADIRKKAQQDKATSGQTLQNSVSLLTEPDSPPDEGLEFIATEMAGHSIPECLPEPPLLFPVTPEQNHPEIFDPLAIIFEGREMAACAEDVLGETTSEVDIDSSENLELLCFRVSTEEYALNIMDIKEIIKPRDVTEVPRVPAFIRGLLSLRGIIIPVFDMSVRLGLPTRDISENRRIIVVKNGDSYCGVLVDEVIQVVRIKTRNIEPPPAVLEGIDREFVVGIGRFDSRMLILLNMVKILDVNLM